MTPARWLQLAQAAWLLVALFYVATFLLALPGLLRQPVAVPSLPSWSAAEARLALDQLGWSADGLRVFLNGSSLLLAPAYMLLGAFIFWRRPNDPMALLVSFTFLIFLSTGQFDSLAQRAPVWAQISNASGSLATALFFLVFLIFPDGRFVPGWTRWAALAIAAAQVFRVFQPALYAQQSFVIAAPMIITVMAAQLYRFARVSGAIQRQQTKWMVFGLTGGILPLSVYFIVVGLVPSLTRPSGTGMAVLLLGASLWQLFVIVLPLSLTLAILRSRLFDIDVILRRTLVYGALTALLAFAYFGSVVVLQNTFSALTGQTQSTLVTVLSTLVIAALFVPLRQRVQAVIDQRLYRRKYDAARTLAAFASNVRDEVEMGALTEQLLSVVDDTLQPASVALWLRPNLLGAPGGPTLWNKEAP